MVTTVEHCTSISINTLQATIRKMIEKDYLEPTVDEIYMYTEKELNKFSVNDQHFEYLAQPNFLGGYRWYFKCPKCKRQANKLFLPPEGQGKELIYLCKTCHGLKNRSAVMYQNSMYQKVTKPLKRMKEIEDKIARGHLKPGTVQELLNEYDGIEAKMKETPEYRLYFFKKKHGLPT